MVLRSAAEVVWIRRVCGAGCGGVGWVGNVGRGMEGMLVVLAECRMAKRGGAGVRLW